MAKIVVSLAGKIVETVTLGEGNLVVGRSPSCDIHLDDKTVSRRHASIRVSRDGITVEDLNSRNGTFISGNRVSHHVVSPGDVITVGPFSISFEDLPASREATAQDTSGQTVVNTLDAITVSKAEDVKEGVVSTEAASRRLSAIYDLSQRLSGRLDTNDVAEAFLDTIFEVFPKIDRCLIFVEDRFAHELSPIAVRPTSASGEVKVSRTVIKTIMEEKRAVLCTDTLSDERFKHAVSLQDLRIRAIMCAPLLIGERVIGMVELDSERGMVLDEDDLRLLVGLASQVSIALDNAMLFMELEQSRRLAAIGQTIASVAHCVKNVLNGIEGGLFIAKRGLEANLEEKIAKGWDMLERNASFLKTLVLDMLDYSKQRPPQYENVNFEKLIIEIRDFVSGRADKGGILLKVEVDSTIGEVRVDPTRMKRALLNIVANAIEATDEGGAVSIRASKCGDSIEICITDTGKGIPEDKLETIFEPFFSTKGNKGTGLGLAVTRKIIEEHRGSIEVASQVGQGTTFTILLPIG